MKGKQIKTQIIEQKHFFFIFFVFLPNNSLDLVEVVPEDFRGEENFESDVVDGQIDEELEERPLFGDFLPVQPQKQERHQKVSNFNQLLQAKRHHGRNDEEDFEADGAVERVEDRGEAEDIDGDDSEPR